MKKYAKILVAVTFLLGLGVAAKAETRPEITAKFPFQFVVGGKTLPAGTYKVSRLGDDPFSVLMLTNDNSTASVFVLPLSIAEPSSDKPKVGSPKHLSILGWMSPPRKFIAAGSRV
jgi:hypothetical protein